MKTLFFIASIMTSALLLMSSESEATQVKNHPLAVQNRISKRLPKTTVLRINEATGALSVYVSDKELAPTDSTELYLKSNETQFQEISTNQSLITQEKNGNPDWFLYFYNENPFYPAFYMKGHVYKLSYYYSFFWYGHSYRLYRWHQN